LIKFIASKAGLDVARVDTQRALQWLTDIFVVKNRTQTNERAQFIHLDAAFGAVHRQLPRELRVPLHDFLLLTSVHENEAERLPGQRQLRRRAFQYNRQVSVDSPVVPLECARRKPA
jgi:hypothetical protein